MTIAAGFRCQGGIILCADTEETIGEHLKVSAPKIYMLISHGNFSVGIAGAGHSDLIAMAVEEIERAIVPGDTVTTIKQKIKGAMTALHRQQVRFYPAPDERKPSVQLLVAAWAKDEPLQLWKVDGTLIHDSGESDYIGWGAILASYLGGLHSINASILDTILLATHVLKQTKKHVPYCGGDSHILLLRKDGVLSQAPLGEVVERETYFAEFSEAMRSMLFACANWRKPDKEFEIEYSMFCEKVKEIRNKFKASQEEKLKFVLERLKEKPQQG